MSSSAKTSGGFAIDGRVSSPGFARATLLIVALTVASVLKRRRLIFLFLLLCMPPFISGVMKSEGVGDGEGFLPFFPQAFFLFLTPLVSYFQGMSLFAEEVDNRTIGYLLLRPISRDALLFGKFIGATLTNWMLVVFSSAASFAIWRHDGDYAGLLGELATTPYLGTAATLLLACALYTAFSMLVALSIRHPMLFGIIYLLVVEVAFAYLPGPPSKIALSHHLSRLAPDIWITASELVSTEMGIEVLRPDRPLLLLSLLSVLAGLLALSVFRLRATDFSMADGE